MLCKHCGREIGPDNRFCDYCGKPVKGGKGWIPVLILSLLLSAAAAGIWIRRTHAEGTQPDAPSFTTVETGDLTMAPTGTTPETEPTFTESPTQATEPAVQPSETTRPEEEEPVISGFDPGFWAQDFYGFVLYTNATGIYSDGTEDYLMEVMLNETADGGDFAMKGEACPADQANVLCSFRLTDGVTSRGSLVSTEIWLAGMEDQQWQIDPGTGFSMNYGDMICMGGHFEDESGSFDYSFFLRPWGTRWEDVAVQYPDLLPGRYEDWYLPLIEAGQPMPEAFS